MSEWKRISVDDHYTGYQICREGRIRQDPVDVFILGGPKRKPRKAGFYTQKNGYKKVKLPVKNGYRWFYVHVLVMEYFGPEKPFDGALIDHKDANKRNCNLSNLEWVTPAENTRRAYKMGVANPKRGSANAKSKLSEVDVAAIRIAHAMGRSTTELASVYGVSRKLVYDIVNRNCWTHV